MPEQKPRQLKLPSPVVFLSSLLLFLGAGAAWYVNDLYRDLSVVLDLNVASVRAAEELEIGLREIRTRLNEFIYRGSEKEVEAIGPLKANTDKWLAEADRLATTDAEKEIIARVTKGYSHFFKSLDQILALGHDSEQKSELTALINVILTKEIIAPAHEYLDYNENTMLAVAKEHQVFSTRISLSLLAIGICGSIGGFGTGLLAARRYKQSMVELNLPLSLAAGKLSEVVGPIRLSTSLDLRELKRILEALATEVDQVVARLQKTQQEVLQSEKLAAIGQLAAGIAHEIRNPLMSVKLLVQSALAKGGATVITDEDLRLINQENGRLERTVQNLLDFARPPKPERQEFLMSRLLAHCKALVQGRAEIQRVTVSERLGADQRIEGDYQQLQQVVLNMLINSLDATPEGGEIRILMERDGFKVRISVQDDGQGIPEHLMPVLFEPFTSGKETGTGLGLSISRQIVHAHKGEVFAFNRDGGGSVVGFSIPAPAGT